MHNAYTIIPKKVRTMDELQNQKAVEHNDLITSVAKMDKIPLKIFELAVSCIDTENPPKDNIIYLSKDVLFSFFDVSSTNKHTRFKNALTTLHKQSVFEVREEEKNGKFSFAIISPISSSRWNDYNDRVAIKFTDDIMPYLIHLKSNFTQYLITDIMELNSKYSIVLYKWLSMNFNQYEKYKDTQKRRVDQLEQLKNPYITIEESRRMTNTTEEYSRMYDFEKNVLQAAKSEINKYTHFTINYEKVKKGRRVEGIKFYIKKQKVKATLPYKENDEIYQKDVSRKEKEKQSLFSEAIQNKYTTILGENLLIGFRDMQNVDLMATLQSQVYPLYDELKKSRGMNGVKEHVNYVKSHMYGSSRDKQNIAKYLKRSIEQYLLTVKLQDVEQELE